MRNIKDEALAATHLTMRPSRRILRASDDAARATHALRGSEYDRKWNKVYTEMLAELKEDQDAGH